MRKFAEVHVQFAADGDYLHRLVGHERIESAHGFNEANSKTDNLYCSLRPSIDTGGTSQHKKGESATILTEQAL